MEPTSQPSYRLLERHRLRRQLCRLLDHGLYEERDEETDGALRISTVVHRACSRGHTWETWERTAQPAPSAHETSVDP